MQDNCLTHRVYYLSSPTPHILISEFSGTPGPPCSLLSAESLIGWNKVRRGSILPFFSRIPINLSFPGGFSTHSSQTAWIGGNRMFSQQILLREGPRNFLKWVVYWPWADQWFLTAAQTTPHMCGGPRASKAVWMPNNMVSGETFPVQSISIASVTIPVSSLSEL